MSESSLATILIALKLLVCEQEPIRAETSPHGQTLFAFGPLVRGAVR